MKTETSGLKPVFIFVLIVVAVSLTFTSVTKKGQIISSQITADQKLADDKTAELNKLEKNRSILVDSLTVIEQQLQYVKLPARQKTTLALQQDILKRKMTFAARQIDFLATTRDSLDNLNTARKNTWYYKFYKKRQD